MPDCLKCTRFPELGRFDDEPNRKLHEPWCPGCRKKHPNEYAPIYAEWIRGNTGALLRGMGVPARYQACTLDSLVVEGDSQRRVLQVVRAWLDSETPGLFLCGPCGTGKTHLAVGALLDIRELRYSGRFVSVQELLLECRDSFRNDSGLNSVLEKYSDYDALLLDDLGAENSTPFAQETVGTLIDRAYRKDQQLIVTSNFDLDDLAKRLNMRIADRLVEMCRLIKFAGPSYRQKIAAKRAAALNLPAVQLVQ
jgi:DNA replication protein DnaC